MAGVTAVAAGGLGFETVREAFAFQVRHERRALAGLRSPLRAAILADLHIGPYLHQGHLEAWVRAAAAVSADVILVVGDLVDHWYRGDLSEFRRLLPELRAPLGEYVVAGNHDRARYPDLGPWRRMLDDVRYRLLLNDGLWLREDVYLAGVDDLLQGAPDPARALAGAGASPRGRAASVLMSHNPDLIPDLGSFSGLVLSGHTHGGQVCIPGIGPVVTSSAYGTRFVAGWVRAPMPAFVTRGLGVTLVPMRLACPAELVVMDLVPA